MVKLKEVRNMFWGVTLNGGKRYTQTIDRSFHLSMAALEAGTVLRTGDDKYVSVMIQYEKAEFLLCTLIHGRSYQQSLDLNFTEGEEVTFSLNGTGVVHLTGFLIEEEMENLEDTFTDSELDSDEIPELLDSETKDSAKKPASKRKSSSNTSIQKKLKLDELSDDSDEEEIQVAVKKYMKKDNSDSDSDYDEFDDEEMDDDDDSSEEEEQEVFIKTPKGKNHVTPSKSDKKLKQTPSTEKKASKTSLKEESLTDERSTNVKTEKKTPSKNLNVSQNGEPKTTETESTKKKKKKKKKKRKNSLTPEESEQKTPSEKQTPKKQVLSGGTLLEEIKIGHGPEAKSGKMVHVYYAGKLSNNGKQFDSKLQGAPFKFRLGKHEVITGWDSGLIGMKVGGKRRLTVPPSQGYGNSRQGPIPPGSTLVFDIELKAVS